MKKVVLLCDQSLTSKLMAEALAKEGLLTSILVTTRMSFSKRIKFRIRKLGVATVISQIGAMIVSKIIFQLKNGKTRQAAILARMALKGEWPPQIKKEYVGPVNSEKCRVILAEQNPECVVVNGTDIIKEPLLTTTNATFINTHCGLTPRYRGVHGGFWALWSKKPEEIGVTIHFVDKGVDTGKIISQRRVKFNKSKDGFYTLPLLQYEEAIPALLKFLGSGETEQTPIQIAGQSKQWFYPTLRCYLQLLLKGEIAF